MPITLQKAKKPALPKFLITLYGASLSGKTSLLATLPGSIFLLDAGGRFMEKASKRDDIFVAYHTAKENCRIQDVTKAIAEIMPTEDASIENIVYDDFTMAFQTLVAEQDAMPQSGTGSRETKGHKARVMKAFRRELFGYGKNVVIVYHTHKAGDGRSDDIVEKKTLSDIEIGRTNMFINMRLRVDVDAQTGRRGVHVEFNRNGHSGFTLWDDSGCWKGFWERLQDECYKGLTWDDMNRIAASIPTSFHDESEAWAWGMEQGCFKDMNHVSNAFAKMLRENEIDPDDVWGAWIADVQARKASVKATTFASADQALAWAVALGVFTDVAASKAAYEAIKGDKKPQKATEMFAYWIQHVHDLLDTPSSEREMEPDPDPVLPTAATESGDGDQSEDQRTTYTEPSYTQIIGRLPADVLAYITEVKAAANGTVVSRAQIANLRAAIVTTGLADPETVFEGMPKTDWIANILAGRGYESLEQYPAGAAKIVFQHLMPPTDERKNAKFDPTKVEVVKQIATILDQAIATQ